MDHQADESVIVTGFHPCLCGPFGQPHRCPVFELEDDALAVQADAADVAAVFGAVSASAFYAVVVEGFG
jgi:hypothetical protein